MPEVMIEVAGRSYRVGCGEGEEEHVALLAERIDAEAMPLSRKMGQISEGRLMLLSALMLADKLVDAETAQANAEARVGKAASEAKSGSGSAALTPERDAEIARNLDALTERIEALVERVGGAA